MRMEELKDMVQERLGNDFLVETQKSVKNNGVELNSICIRKIGLQVGPIFHIDDPDSVNLDELVERIRKEFDGPMCNANFGEIASAEYIRENVIPYIVNAEKNAKTYDEKEIVNRDFLDFKVAYRVRINEGSYILSQSVMDRAGFTEEEIHEIALKNVENIAEVKSMDEVIGIPSPAPMFIIMTEFSAYGAGCVLSDAVLEKVHEMVGSDEIIIIPSSVHELIAIPESAGEDSAITSMIVEVNECQVDEKDRLSNHCYHHSKEKGWWVA